nr:MAG TPA: Intein splicing domain [Caudoviricetes sp.]
MGGTQGCFTGDTKISLVDGRELSLVELVDEFNRGKQNYVYSFKEKTKRIEPKLIEKAWCTLRDASLVEITLDNGEKLRCTPNHKFMLRDSTYCEAQNLKTGDSLMPLYRKYLTEAQSPLYEYRLYYEPMEDKWHYEHRRFCEEVLSDSKQIVHHKNCNKKDNSPCNLIYCSKGEHQKIHAELCTGAHSPEAEKKRSLSISQWHENAKGTEVYTERSRKLHDANLKQHGKTEADYLERQDKLAQQRLHGQELRKKAEETKQKKAEYIQAIENLYGVVWEDLSASERSGYGVKFQRFNHPESIESMRNAISAKHSLGEYENAKTALARCNQESKKLKELCPEVDPERFFNIFGFEYASLEPKYRAPWITKYRKIVCKEILNHKVVSVKILDYTEDVYDLTVQDNHNFALTAGVFVHNSKDQADAVCGALYSAS